MNEPQIPLRLPGHDPEPQTPQVRALLALNRVMRNLYEGSVPAHVTAARRAKNERARAARRAQRRSK